MAIDKQIEKITGRGLLYPITLNADGGVDLVTGPNLIRSSIRIIVFWALKTRYKRHEFGSILESLLHEPNAPTVMPLAQQYIVDALTMWEKRIEIEPDNIVITQDNDRLSINITYFIKNSNLTDTFIIPYYKKFLV
jgi:phage baseplate assembly protein W